MTKPALPPTALVVTSFAGKDYFLETKRGYSERDAYDDIRQGQIENCEQVMLITATGGEDITARIAERITDDIANGQNVATSAAEFAERFGGYVPKLTRAEIAEQRAEYLNDCAREDRV
jgi:phosphoenolpyruvate synthase/pyruvate phosphate dikinase